MTVREILENQAGIGKNCKPRVSIEQALKDLATLLPKDEEVVQAIHIAKLIIKGYEERGGGYSQIEALKTLINHIDELHELFEVKE